VRTGSFSRTVCTKPRRACKVGPANGHRYAVKILCQTGNLDLLGACRLPLADYIDTVRSLPSWVLDWNLSTPFRTLILRGFAQELCFSHFAASGCFSSYSPIFSEDRRLLGLRGHFVDEIVSDAGAKTQRPIPPYRPRNFELSSLELIRQIYQQPQVVQSWTHLASQFRGQKYLNGEDNIDAVWQTVCCGSFEPEGYEASREMFLSAHTFHLLLTSMLMVALYSEWIFVIAMLVNGIVLGTLKSIYGITVSKKADQKEWPSPLGFGEKPCTFSLAIGYLH
jgi:hypothetical protein